MTERGEVANSAYAKGTTTEIADEGPLASAGATGARVATMAGRVAANIGRLVALRPAPTGPDTADPTIPQGLHTTAVTDTSRGLGLGQGSGDNSGVIDHYTVYRDGTAVGTSPTPAFTDDTVGGPRPRTTTG